tara:strand:+ start:3042 stop:3557 length:516 start_codon:yes stop_codon:yes gene_type:complete
MLPNLSLYTGTEEQAGTIALFLFAYNQYLDNQSNEHWGSELDVNIQNVATGLASIYFGYDIAEDPTWTAYCNKATSSEIAQYTIDNILKKKGSSIPQGERLLVVALESVNILQNMLQMVVDTPESFCFFTDDNLTEDVGWEAHQSQVLMQLEKGDAVSDFGDFYHTIVRLR